MRFGRLLGPGSSGRGAGHAGDGRSRRRRGELEGFHGDVVVRVDAEPRSDEQRAARDLLGAEVGALQERRRGGVRVWTAAADGDDAVAVVGFDDLAVAAQQQDAIGVGDDQHRLETAQVLVGAPLLAQPDRRAHEVALVLVEVLLELVEERQRVGDGAGEPADHLTVKAGAGPSRRALHHDVADGHLPVACHGDRSAALHRHDGRRVRGGHAMRDLRRTVLAGGIARSS